MFVLDGVVGPFCDRTLSNSATVVQPGVQQLVREVRDAGRRQVLRFAAGGGADSGGNVPAV